MRRLKAQNAELASRPPPEFFLSLYFQVRKWWTPPGEFAGPEPEEQVPLAATLPEFED